jgi:hypothetical protein
MLTFRDIHNCEGYYYNVETGTFCAMSVPARPAVGPKDHGSK